MSELNRIYKHLSYDRTTGKVTSMYNRWRNMLQRCYNSKDKRYMDYGGRGITVCHEWRWDYDQFVDDIEASIGPCPGKEWSLDRIDNNKGYEPGNMQWATAKTQAQHRRNTVT